MNKFTEDELGVLLELVRQYARVCDSDFYEAYYAGKSRRAKSLKLRFDAIDALYDRIMDVLAEDHQLSTNAVVSQQIDDLFEKRLVETYAKTIGTKSAVAGNKII